MPRHIDKLGFSSLLIVFGSIACSGSQPLQSDGDPAQSEDLSSASSSATPCTKDAECPATKFCDDTGYGPSKCRAKRAVGAYCGDARECKSGACTSYVCAAAPPPPVCKTVGKHCMKDAECCAGFCSNMGGGYGYGYGYGYGSSHCSAPQPNGSSCVSNGQCTSGRCDQYECKATVASCSAVGKACASTADCCGTNFCNTNTYAPPTCTAPRASGDYCQTANECQSGNCLSYICQ